VAIFWDDVPKVRDILKRGADPNGWAGRQRFLGKALERNSLSIVELLLKAGADPRLPYNRMGMEFKMSDAARRFEYHELADRLKEAESKAESCWGVLPLKNSSSSLCPR